MNDVISPKAFTFFMPCLWFTDEFSVFLAQFMAWLLPGTPRTSKRLRSVDATDFIHQNIIKSYEIIPVQIDYRIDPSILSGGVVLLQSLHSSFYIFRLLYICILPRLFMTELQNNTTLILSTLAHSVCYSLNILFILFS